MGTTRGSGSQKMTLRTAGYAHIQTREEERACDKKYILGVATSSSRAHPLHMPQASMSSSSSSRYYIYS
eukprot:1157687-Pelagomonas_calceolata.AAC.4